MVRTNAGKASPEPKRSEGAPVYLTAAQVAALLRVSVKTVYRLAPPIRRCRSSSSGGSVRFPRERLLRWLQDRARGPGRPRRISNQVLSSAKSASAQQDTDA